MKQNIVLYDSDTKLKDSDLSSQNGVSRVSKIATGYSPQKLYELYGQAKAAVDLQLPGGERFIYEAALFDVCLIVDDALNGANVDDFPIPHRFRVPPNDLAALNRAVDECISNYHRVIDEFKPVKQLVLHQRETFMRQVRRYFSNSVHVVTVACSDTDVKYLVPRFIVATLIQVPYAVIEVVLPRGLRIPPAIFALLSENSWLAAVVFSEHDGAKVAAACRPHDAIDAYTRSIAALFFRQQERATTNAKRTLLTMFLPLNAIVLNEDVVHFTSSAMRVDAVSSPGSLVGFYSTAKDSESRLQIPLMVFYTRDSSRWGSCRVLTHIFGALAPSLCESRAMAGDAPLSVRDGTAATEALVTTVDEAGESYDETSRPRLQETLQFFCEHEVWRAVVGAKGASGLKCGS
jgi:hypothetical protein